MFGGFVAALAVGLAGGSPALGAGREAALVHRAPPPLGATPRPESRAPGARGELVAVPVRGAGPRGDVVRFVVEVEGGLPIDRHAFAAIVERTLTDRRGWARWGERFVRVAREPAALRVALVSPATTDRLCAPLATNGRYSCASEERAVLNFRRWQTGSLSYAGDLRRYRIYMINHEVGHLLGSGHSGCPRAGAKAPVMMQQTKGVGPCKPNPWPLADER